MKHKLRVMLAMLAMVSATLVVVALPASADAPDSDMSSTPSVTAQVAQDGTVSVSVTGQWKWTSRSRNCNTDKRGVGVAIDWNDPSDSGNYVATANGTSYDVGTTTDNVVHPATSVGLPNGGTKIDIASPSQYASWRGGCGTYSYDPVLKKSYNSGSYGPLTHDYKPIGGQTQTVIKLCAVLYDVSLSSIGGAPSKASSVTAGGNNDNSDNNIVKNPASAGGSNCKEITVTPPDPPDTCQSNSVVPGPSWVDLPTCGTVTPGQFNLSTGSYTTVVAQAYLADGEHIGLACLDFTFKQDLLDPGEGFTMIFLDTSTGPTITNTTANAISQLQWCFPLPYASFRWLLDGRGWYPNGWPVQIKIAATANTTARVNMWLDYKAVS